VAGGAKIARPAGGSEGRAAANEVEGIENPRGSSAVVTQAATQHSGEASWRKAPLPNPRP